MIDPVAQASAATLPRKDSMYSVLLAVALVLMLILNGMTTPGIFQDWSVNNLAFFAVLGDARVGARRRAASRPTPASRSSVRRTRSAVGIRPRLAG